MPKSLADGTIKLAILSSKPANPLAPTVSELNAGIDASCRILSSDYLLGATDSDKIAEKELCKAGNSNALGPSNYQAALTPFRYWNTTTDASDVVEDTVYQALRSKGATLYLYERQTSKLSTEAWANGDEVSGFEVVTDNPQKPSETGGYIKRRVPMEVQDAWLNGTVGGGIPVVTSLAPTTGAAAGGTDVLVRGSGFSGATVVKFGTVNATAIIVVDDEAIVATSPAHAAGAINVTVTTPAGVSTSTATFTYS
jgi:hypothetical protein